MKRDIAAAKAREMVLRDALLEIRRINCSTRVAWINDEALRTPTDDTALKAAIQQGIADFLERTGQYVTNDASRNAALAAERKRCEATISGMVGCGTGWNECVDAAIDAIRELGD